MSVACGSNRRVAPIDGGEAAPKKMKTSNENEVYDGTMNNVNGLFFSIELPMLQGTLKLIEEHEHGCRPILQTILWTYGIELESSCVVNKTVNDPVIISSITPKGPAAHDGRLKAADRILSVNGTTITSSVSSVSAMADLKGVLARENLKLKVFRQHGAYEEGAAASTEPLLGAQFSAKLLQNPRFSDIVFQVGNEKIPSYRVVIAEKSPVFEAMLTHDMTEKKTGIIKIEGFEPTVFRSLLNFIYANELEFTDASVAHLMELVRAADFYDVKGLKEKVSQRLHFYLSKETAVEMLIMADKFKLEDFREKILMFIAMWSLDITLSSSFSDLGQYPDLLLRLFRVKSEAGKDDQEFLFDLAKAKFNVRPEVLQILGVGQNFPMAMVGYQQQHRYHQPQQQQYPQPQYGV